MSDCLHVRPLTFGDLDSIIAVKGNVIKRPEFNPIIERNIYEWGLRRNPYRRDDFPIGFVLEHNTNIVGFVVLVPAKFKLGKENVYACFEIDLMVAPEFRFHGIKLLNKVWNENLFPLVISTTPNKVSYKIEQKMGAAGIIFTSCKYIKFINFRFGMSRIKNIRYEKLISWLSSMKQSIFKNRNKINKNKEIFSVEEVTKFDKRFDDLFLNISTDYDVLQMRDSHFLKWRYIDFPYGMRKIFTILDRKGKLRGFIVIQKEKSSECIRKVNIIDLFTRKNDIGAVQTLLSSVIKYSKSENLDYIEIVPNSSALEYIIRGEGFMQRKFEFPACLYKCSKEEISKIGENMDCWFISSGDGDTSFYPAVSYGYS